jgi:glycosyltransferase involved in cell wall biosynthesis
MRLLISASTFPTAVCDGTPRFIRDLADALSIHADVSVLAPGTPDAPLFEQAGSIRIHRFSYFWPPSQQRLTPRAGRGMRENISDSWLARFQLPGFLHCQARSLRRLVREQQIDTVNAHWIIPQGYTAVRALRGMDSVRLILHIHAGDVYLLRRLPLGRAIARYVVRRADAIFADGSHVRDTLNELVGWDVGAQLQPMGVYCDQFQASDTAEPAGDDLPPDFEAGYILFVGRLVEKKGTTFLVRAMQQIAAEFPGLGLLIVGTGPLQGSLQQEVDELGLHDRVCFAGARPHSQIAHLLRKARLVAVPSIMDSRGETEGMPTVVTEAMASGARVVASAVAGIPDVIRDGENGWLCREQDENSLAIAMMKALSTPLATRIQKAAVSTARNYDWKQVAANYMACLADSENHPQDNPPAEGLSLFASVSEQGQP